MSTHAKKMTEGSPGKLILTFAIPLMLGNMLQQAYLMTDTLIVSRTLGVTALAALGASDWLSYMMIAVIQAIAQGFAILIAQDFGAQDDTHMHQSLAHSIKLSVLMTITVTAVSLLTLRPFLNLLRTKEELMGMTSAYLGIIYAGLPAVMLLNFGSSMLRAFGNSKTPLYAIGVSATINIVLDLLFVKVLSFGVQGAAFATVIAQLIAGIYCCYVLSRLDFLHLSKEHFRKVEHLDRDLMKLSWPLMAQNFVIALGGLVLQAQVNQYDIAFVAGYTATNKLYGLLEIAATAYGFSILTYIAQNYGAKNTERMKKGLRSGLLIAIATSILIAVFMVLFGHQILSAFLVGNGSDVAEALVFAFRYLVIMAVPLPVLYILYITRSTLQGLGNTVVPMISGIGECVTRIVVSVCFAGCLGSDAVMYAEIGAWFTAMFILSYSVFKTLKNL